MKIGRINPDNFVDGTTSSDITTTSSTPVIAAQGAGIRTHIQSITVTNSHASTSTVVKILNGSTVRWRNNASAGSGFTLPLFLRGDANAAWSAQCETSGASVQVSLAGFKDSE